MRAKQIWVVVVALSLLAGCGFQLRGTRKADIDAATAYLQSGPADLLLAHLRRTLAYSGVRTVSSPAKADLVIALGRERIERRVLSVDARTGKVREFELDYTVGLTVRRADGQVLVDDESVELQRDFTFDETAVLGKFEEQALLEQDIRADAAATILRRLEALNLD